MTDENTNEEEDVRPKSNPRIRRLETLEYQPPAKKAEKAEK